MVSSDEEEDYDDVGAGEAEEDVGPDGEEEEGQIDDAPANQGAAPPGPPPST
jgi:hypothetical protein